MAGKVILIRHGQSMGNENEEFYGYGDKAVCLTPKGVKQCVEAAKTVSQVLGDVHGHGGKGIMAYVSQYRRAQLTADIVLDRIGRGDLKAEVTPFLNEINLAKERNEFYQRMKEARFEDPFLKAEGGESITECYARVGHWWRSVEPLMTMTNIMVFGHSGVIKSLLGVILECPVSTSWGYRVWNGEPLILNRTYIPLGSFNANFLGTKYEWVYPSKAPEYDDKPSVAA